MSRGLGDVYKRQAYNTAISATRKRKQELIVMDSAMLMNISDQQIDDALNEVTWTFCMVILH